ncbi:transposase family protein [Devosia sp. J2-20]|uniref:integrase catalytic domain-containing protein n=1 Tax=Devosia sp. J2-20 TaxID=3026161 RepID=UPI002499F556|nr:transposase family protein [Devosia sp. J2-20]WDQ99670.1 transposase family protein [Devosia sp. J2-20]
MTLIAPIKLYDTVNFPDRRATFIGIGVDDVMRFKIPNEDDVILLEQGQFLKLLSLGTIRRVPAAVPTKDHKSANEKLVVPPDVSTKKLETAKTLLFYLRRYDSTGSGNLSERQIDRFIARHRAEAQERGHCIKISAGQFMRGLQKGSLGNRHLAPLISRQGEGKRKIYPQEIQRAYKEAVDFYYNNKEASERQAFDILKDRLQDLIDQKFFFRGKLLTIPKSIEVLRTKILEERDIDHLSIKYGRDEAEKLINGSKPFLQTDRPFEYVIIDHTVCDVMAVDDQTDLPLGRPVIALALDVFSRAVVGFWISFEPPSISSLMSIIKNIATCKDHLDSLRIDGQNHTLSFGKPSTILLDRGLENLSDALSDTCAELGIDVDFCPRRNGRAKSPGERIFRSVNDAVFHVLPGCVAHGPTEMRRLQLKPELDATLPLSAITSVLYNALLDYEQRHHRGIQAVPCLKLRAGYEKHGQPMFDDIRVLENQIGDTLEVKLWHYGFDMKGERFINPEATTEIRNVELGRQSAAGKIKPSSRQQSVRMKVKYNPADCNIVHVHFKRGSAWDYVPFYNVNRDYPAGLSFKLSSEIREFARQNDYEYENTFDRIRVRARMAESIQNSHKLRKTTKSQRRTLAALNAIAESAAEERDKSERVSLEEQVAGSHPSYAKHVDTPSATRTDSATRSKGIRRGSAKAAATRKRNQKIVAKDQASHSAMLDRGEAQVPREIGEEQLDFAFSNIRITP